VYPSRRSTLTSQQLALGARRKSIGMKRDGKEFWEARTTYRRGVTPDNLRPYAVRTNNASLSLLTAVSNGSAKAQIPLVRFVNQWNLSLKLTRKNMPSY